ncbi:unnamed protein product [Chrysoparadoxa australica]
MPRLGSELRGDEKRKKETIDGLVLDLCTGAPEKMSSVILSALEGGWREELGNALKEFEQKKRKEISQVCNRHYQDFIASVEELMKMRTDLVSLRNEAVNLNEDVQSTARTALTTTKSLLQLQHAAANIQHSTAVISQCSELVGHIMEAFVCIHEEKYYSALNTMDLTRQKLDEMEGVKFAVQLRSWMPSLTELINKATKDEMSQWLVDIRGVSYKLGGVAMRRYARLHAAEGVLGGDFQAALMTFSVRFMLRLQELLGCSFRLDDSELDEYVPEFLREASSEQAAEAERALDHLSDYLHPVHRALHIFDRLQMLSDFKAWYVEYRLPMAELRSMITRDLDNLDTNGLLTYLPTLVNGIVGFCIVEHTLLSKVDHKEGLLSQVQLEEAWLGCICSLRALLEKHVKSLSRPGHFLQVKETVLAMVHLASDLSLDVRPLMDLLRKLKGPYQRLLLLAFKGTCQRIMVNESFQPFEIGDQETYDSCIVPLGLDEHDHSAAGGQTPKRDVITDAFYFSAEPGNETEMVGGLQFPLVLGFSATVPDLGLEFIKLGGMMATFLSHLEVPNAGGLVFVTLESGASIVQQLILDQVAEAEKDLHILKTSQISVNAAYFAKLPLFVATVTWDSLASLQFSEIGYSGASLHERDMAFQSLEASGKSLETISDRARDLIFELLRRKIDELMVAIQFVDWQPSTRRRSPQGYADDCINYLRVTFMNLSTLPASMREAAHFTCMSYLCSYILEHMLGPQVPAINSLGIYNISLDINALVEFSDESDIAQLSECFSQLKQLVDLLLGNDIDLIVNFDRRQGKFPSVDEGHIVTLLEKYRDLGMAAKIKNTIGNEIPQLEQKQVKAILHHLRGR